MCWTTLSLRALLFFFFFIFALPRAILCFTLFGIAIASQMGPWRSARRMCRGKKKSPFEEDSVVFFGKPRRFELECFAHVACLSAGQCLLGQER